MEDSPWLDKPTIVGERVVLRPFTGADVEAMGAVLADPDVLRLTGSVHSAVEAQAASPVLDEATRRWYATRAEQDDRLDLAIVERAADVCVGEVVLNEWQRENGCVNLRIAVGPTGRDRGLGSEAVRLVVDHAFEVGGVHRVELEVYASNPRARAVYERAGFVVEGVRRDALLFDGAYVDAIVMAVLRLEWASRQGGR